MDFGECRQTCLAVQPPSKTRIFGSRVWKRFSMSHHHTAGEHVHRLPLKQSTHPWATHWLAIVHDRKWHIELCEIPWLMCQSMSLIMQFNHAKISKPNQALPSLPSICLLDFRAYRACDLLCSRVASEVARNNLLLANTLNTHHQLVGRFLFSKPP